MDKVFTYTSTGVKLLHHPDVVKSFKDGLATPISLQVAPTSKCNLKCSFCSNVNRTIHEELNPMDLVNVVRKLRELGLKTIEFTGGGDPTLYPCINELIKEFSEYGLKVGFITNGVELHRLSRSSLDVLTWLRISTNSLDYVSYIDIPAVSCTLGFSYVINGKTTMDTLKKIKSMAYEHQAKYVRLVPNCQASYEEQDKNNRELPNLARELGEPFFYQTKEFRRPEECYWAYCKPFILHDGYTYPCSSVVLNDTADRQFHSRFRWVHMGDLPHVYSTELVGLSSKDCDHCVFYNQNQMLIELRNGSPMSDFV